MFLSILDTLPVIVVMFYYILQITGVINCIINFIYNAHYRCYQFYIIYPLSLSSIAYIVPVNVDINFICYTHYRCCRAPLSQLSYSLSICVLLTTFIFTVTICVVFHVYFSFIVIIHMLPFNSNLAVMSFYQHSAINARF